MSEVTKSFVEAFNTLMSVVVSEPFITNYLFYGVIVATVLICVIATLNGKIRSEIKNDVGWKVWLQLCMIFIVVNTAVVTLILHVIYG